MADIIDIEGIGETDAAKLQDAGAKTTDALLERAGRTKDREELVAKVGVTSARVLEWVNRADLMRVRGIGSEFSDLPEAAFVDSVRALAQRRTDNLHAKLVEVNEAKKLVRPLPTLPAAEKRVQKAKSLPAAVFH